MSLTERICDTEPCSSTTRTGGMVQLRAAASVRRSQMRVCVERGEGEVCVYYSLMMIIIRVRSRDEFALRHDAC